MVIGVILWKVIPTFATLFAGLGAALFLIARIARSIGGPAIARTAVIVAAIAYPVTTIFLPGRIDHHGLQALAPTLQGDAKLDTARKLFVTADTLTRAPVTLDDLGLR